MLPKGHALSWGRLQLAALAILVALGAGSEALGASRIMPIAGNTTARWGNPDPRTGRRIIGRTRTLPPLPKPVRTQQGSGPSPDTNLTKNAPSTDEIEVSSSPTTTMNRVAFVSNGVDLNQDARIDPTLPTTPGFVPYKHIWIMRPDGSEQIPITADRNWDQIQPAYDPGARLIAFAGKEGPTRNWEIYTVEVRSGEIRCLTDKQPGNKLHPTWSPDGNWIAYQCDVNGNWDIFKMPATGTGTQQQLTTSPEDDTDPAWQPAGNALDPSGNAIAYVTKIGQVTRIYWVNAVTGDTDALTEGGGDALASDADPAWSRDGSMLAFASNRLTEGDQVRDYNIFRCGARGEIGIESTLVSNWDPSDTADDRHPAWSPGLFRQPIRIFFQSQRTPGPGNRPQWDIWATFLQDSRPPMVMELPTIDNRQPQPGEDVVIHVPVFDEDTGVSSVFAIIKDPDRKVWVIDYHTNPRYFNSSVEGVQYLEWDYEPVARVQLFDSGDPADYDAQANDGIFSGFWTTPANVPSDYVIDIVVTDNVGNTQNYDDLGGFTTQIFQPRNNVLLVNDYCEGQFFEYQLGYNNDYPAAWHCESFYTYNPGYGYTGSPDFDTISDYAATQGVTEGYDLWRVICRGRVPESVYQYYLPTVEYQLDPQEAITNPETAAPTRPVRVAERAVVWACPHAGDVWAGPGTLTDADVQADLTFFLQRGGRLFLSGADIAWALTLNGTITNDFLANTLHASFISDGYQLGTTVTNPGGGYSPLQHTDYGFEVVGNAGDVVADDAWAGSGSAHWSGAHRPLEMETPADLINNITHGDAHEWSIYPDRIAETAGAIKIYGYRGYDSSQAFADSPTAGIRYEDPATSAKLIYLAFGFESIHRQYSTNEGCHNHRSHLMHNALCWMRTGAFQGRVLSYTDGMRPVNNPNPIVRLWRGDVGPPFPASTPDFAVRCQDDGTYVISGLPPGRYTLEAARPGYEVDRYDGYVTHGGWQPYTVDFAIGRSKPGGVAGTVTSEASGQPLALVQVRIYPVPQTAGGGTGGTGTTAVKTVQTGGQGQEPDWGTLGQPVGTATTAVNGSYSIGDLPPGDYYIIADGSAIGYGHDWAQITIRSGNLTTQDFELPAADGTIVAVVRDATTSAPIPNALVEAKSAQGITVGSGVTDASGTARIQVQPGSYQAAATAAGYGPSQPQPVVVASNEERAVTLTLQALPPGSITGKIISATSRAPVEGVLVKLISNQVVLATTTTGATLITPPEGGAPYNFRFDNVPAGTIIVHPAPVGFTATPTERTVQVASGAITSGVDFVLSSLHTFPAGLQLISMPYDYSAIDPAVLLGVNPAELQMAAWEPSRQRYRLYPQAPSDAFRSGVGYWLRLKSATDITKQGDEAPDPMAIPLAVGWNMIGAPFPVLIDFYSVVVEDRGGNLLSVQQALSNGLLEGGMFAYVLGGYQSTSVFNPWVGTWIRAGEPVTLHVSRSAALAAVRDARPPVAKPTNGWLVGVEVTAGNMLDTATYFGAAPSATNGYDRGLDMPKPPAPDFAPCVYAAFANDGWGPRSGAYSVDIRSSRDSSVVWPLEVQTNIRDADVTLRWPDLSAAPADVKPVLTDLATGKQVYMRTSASYTFRANGAPRRFAITLSGSAASALTLSGVSAQQLRGTQSQIVYTLSKAARVEIKVVNIAGVTVRQVCEARDQAAGTHTAVWDGRNAAGVRVPAGRYLVTVTARDDSGQQRQVVVPLELRGK